MKIWKKLQKYLLSIPKRLLDKNEYRRIVGCYTYAIMTLIALAMTVVNCFTNVEFLLVTTATATGLFALNFFLSFFSKKGVRIAGVLFGVEIVALFSYFVVWGNPQGFSIIWLTLLPPVSMLFYGRWRGSVMSGMMFLILAFFLWSAPGLRTLEQVGNVYYSETFKLRFPLLFTACFALAFILSSVQMNAMEAVETLNRKNEAIADHDMLTGLYNRAGLIRAIETERRYCDAAKLGFAILDIDHFKDINDEYGHIMGDEALKTVSDMMTKHLHGTVARWGGDEFLVLYYNDEISKRDFDNLRREVEAHEFLLSDGQPVHFSVSVGVFETASHEFGELRHWLKKADDALYASKNNGRNRVTYCIDTI